MRHYQEITKIGYSELPRLSAQQLSDIHNYLKYKPLYVRFMHGEGASYTHDAIPQGINMLEYDSLTVAQCPHLLELANCKLYIGIAQKILRCRPTISSLSIWYSNHRAASPKDTELGSPGEQ
jgi:hypothetical protein